MTSGEMNEVFRLPLEMSRLGSKQGLKNDVDGSSILQVVESIRNEMYIRPMFFIGRILVGVVRIFSLRVDSFALKIQAVMNHIDKVLSYDSAPKERKPRRLPTSAQRRALRNAVTLPTVPEANPILAINLEDVIFENTTIPHTLPLPPIMSTTPGGPDSGRKRRLSTSAAASSTPSRRRFPSSPFDNILMTPDGFSLDSDPEHTDARKRTRRMSSISEVIDSLREDDGSRRLSGLMGSRQPRESILTTAGNSPAQSPDDDLFDIPETAEWDDQEEDHTPFLQTPLQPVSTLLQLTTGPRPTPKRTRKSQGPPTIKSLMDKKGKRGIEIDLSVLNKRHAQLLEFTKSHPLYIPNPTHRILFPISEFYRDFSSHIPWYKAPPPVVQVAAPPPRGRTRIPSLPTRPSPEDPYEAPFDDIDIPPEPPLENPGNNNSFLDKIARAKNPILMSAALSRNRIVADFVQSLHYVSEGVLDIERSDTERKINLNSVDQTRIARGPRWESFILS